MSTIEKTSATEPSQFKRITISDLARELNLSGRAVSQALNPRESSVKVSPDTIKRVQALAKKLGYRPDSRARSMRYGKFFNIGYFEAKKEAIALPLPGAQAGVFEVASDSGYRVVLIRMPSELSENPNAIPNVFQEDLLDVLILSHAGNLSPQLIEQIDSSGYPVVYLNEKREYNSVYSDDIAGAEIITQHLINQGYSRIACLAFPADEEKPHYSIADRTQGYHNALSKAGLTPIMVDLGKNRKDGPDRLISWFESNHQDIDAIMCISDFYAMQLMRILYDYRHLFPKEIALSGYDNLGRVLSAIPLTTMDISFYHLGRDAVKMAIELVNDRSRQIPSISVVPQLIVGKSTPPRT